MKVQTRLSLFNSVIFGIIFAIISILIYTSYSQSALKSIYNNLKKTSQITGLYYLEEDELNKDEFEVLKRQFNKFVTNSFYQIYNDSNKISYGSLYMNVSPEILETIRSQKSLEFSDKDFFCYGIFYEDNQGDFVVVTREKRESLQEQLNTLLWILIPAFIIGILAIIILSRWIAHIAYRPFRNTIDEVNNISAGNSDMQIQVPQTNDELQDLIVTFNKLLTKISDAFIIQKNFVSYVSHEFKTPLASMLGNLEVFSIKERSPEEYEQVAQKLIKQITQLEDILNTLLIISDLRKDADSSTLTRIDDLIWEIIDKVSELHHESRILVSIDVQPEDESILNVSKDRTQLLMALFNLVENAVKYSLGKPVEVSLYKGDEGTLCISIKDNGIGIPANQMENITKPFFRADNANQQQGHGIGLSIALKILENNNIQFRIESEENVGSNVLIVF